MEKNKVTIKKNRSGVSRKLSDFFKRFHLLLFFILVVACLAAGVLLLNQTLTETSDQEFTSDITAGSIDQSTLTRIEALHTSDRPNTPPTIPAGRINAFSE